MNYNNTLPTSLRCFRPVYLLIIGICAFAVGLSIDVFLIGPERFYGISQYRKFYGVPYFGSLHIFKVFLSVFSSICFVFAVILSSPLPPPTTNRSLLSELAVVISLLLFSGFTALFLYSPYWFYKIALEDGYLEWASAIFLFGSSALFIMTFTRLYVARLKKTPIYLLIATMFAGIFCIIGLEEVSWFQRVFDIDTPFSGNQQGESNFHNYNTGLFDHAYYFGAFFFLIFLPFVNSKTTLFAKMPFVKFFIPSRSVQLFSAPLAAFNFFLWNSQISQLSFFVTLFILMYDVWSKRNSIRDWYLSGGLLGVMCVAQCSFIYNRWTLAQYWSWDLAEYKEAFIAASFLFYSIEIFLASTEKARITKKITSSKSGSAMRK